RVSRPGTLDRCRHADPRTMRRERADRAAGLACDAVAAAVEDQPVGEYRPALLRDDRHERELDLDRVLLAREPEASREPRDVRVHDDPRDPEGVPEHHVRRLAPDPTERDQLLQGAGHLAAVLSDDVRAALADRPRLVAEEPGR